MCLGFQIREAPDVSGMLCSLTSNLAIRARHGLGHTGPCTLSTHRLQQGCNLSCSVHPIPVTPCPLGPPSPGKTALPFAAGTPQQTVKVSLSLTAPAHLMVDQGQRSPPLSSKCPKKVDLPDRHLPLQIGYTHPHTHSILAVSEGALLACRAEVGDESHAQSICVLWSWQSQANTCTA